MGREEFVSDMFECVASKFVLEPLRGPGGCERTGTECAADPADAGKGLESFC